MSLRSKKLRTNKIIFSILFLLGGCISAFQFKMIDNLTRSPVEGSLTNVNVQRELSRAFELKMILKSPTFGFRNTLANWSFLDFLQYFGDEEIRATEGYDLTHAFFEPIIYHDPYYRPFYLFLSGSNSIYAANPQKSIALMNNGINQLSPNQPQDSYYIWRYKGVDELLFLNDSESAQHSFETASIWAKKSKNPGSEVMEKLSRRTARYLSSNPQSKAALISAWSSVLTNALDNRTRQRAIEQIQDLGGNVIFSEDGGIRIEFAQKDNEDTDS